MSPRPVLFLMLLVAGAGCADEPRTSSTIVEVKGGAPIRAPGPEREPAPAVEIASAPRTGAEPEVALEPEAAIERSAAIGPEAALDFLGLLTGPGEEVLVPGGLEDLRDRNAAERRVEHRPAGHAVHVARALLRAESQKFGEAQGERRGHGAVHPQPQMTGARITRDASHGLESREDPLARRQPGAAVVSREPTGHRGRVIVDEAPRAQREHGCARRGGQDPPARDASALHVPGEFFEGAGHEAPPSNAGSMGPVTAVASLGGSRSAEPGDLARLPRPAWAARAPEVAL